MSHKNLWRLAFPHKTKEYKVERVQQHARETVFVLLIKSSYQAHTTYLKKHTAYKKWGQGKQPR